MALDDLPWFIVFSSTAMGLLVGSFLNVCIFRLPRECMSIVRPRSRCVTCLRPIRWYENIPVLSWLLLRGHCRGCGKGISVRYPLVELMTGGAFFYVTYMAFVHPGSGLDLPHAVTAAVLVALISSLIVCSFIDLDHRIIPDEITIPGIILALAVGTAFPEWHGQLLSDVIANSYVAGLATSGVGVLVGGGSIWVIGVIGSLMFRKEAMGFGDVKYMAFLGGFLGWEGVLLSIVLACFFGSVIGIMAYLITRDRYIPFGPFLSMGAVIMLLFRDPVYQLIRWYMNVFAP